MPASLSVAAELARAVGGVLLLPWRIGAYLVARERHRADVRTDLERPSEIDPAPDLGPLPDRPLVVFVACAEPSGEIHACNLVRAIRARVAEAGGPEPAFVGLGGARLAELGVRTVGDPVGRAAMGLGGWWRAVPFYLGLLRDAVRAIDAERPDVLVPVDSPALHVPLARLARRRGVRVVHFVTPQYWGWAPWRVRGYRGAVDLALTILPFEPAWFARAGVRTAHVGHPLLDELPVPPARPEDGPADGPLVLLPGSRQGVVDRNLPWMLRVLAAVRERVPDLRVVLPHSRPELAALFEPHLRAAGSPPWLTVEPGDLHGALRGARSAFSVSGTVLVDLLVHRLPAVVVYRLAGAREAWMYRHLLTSPWFASPNLLAAREVLPELCFAGDGPLDEAARAIERAHRDGAWRAACRSGLEAALARLGPPGATSRAAGHTLAEALEGRGRAGGKVVTPENRSTRENGPGEPTYAAPAMDSEATRLMQATKGGDPHAFDQLVDRLRGRAFSMAHSLVGTREDALDLAQEAFLKTYRARDTFRDGEPFLPWFHRILRNTCFSFLRKRARLRPISIHADPDDDRADFEILDDGPPPSAGVEREELAGVFWQAFRALGARDREILDLRHFQDLAYREIAEVLGCPVGTVMSRLFHARRRLRERLSPYLESDVVPERAGGAPDPLTRSFPAGASATGGDDR